MKLFWVMGAVAALSAGAAQASTISATFNLEWRGDAAATGSDKNTLIIEKDNGLTGTFEGRYFNSVSYTGDVLTGDKNAADAMLLGRYTYGAGVKNVSRKDAHTVDGWCNTSVDNGCRRDFIEGSFSYLGTDVDVTLTSLKFGYIGSAGYRLTNSSFELLVDSTGDGSIDLGDLRALAGNAKRNVDLTGEELTSGAFGFMAGLNGSWKLNAVTISFTLPSNEEPTPEIPLPAAGWLLIGGLGSLTALRRFRKNA